MQEREAVPPKLRYTAELELRKSKTLVDVIPAIFKPESNIMASQKWIPAKNMLE